MGGKSIPTTDKMNIRSMVWIYILTVSCSLAIQAQTIEKPSIVSDEKVENLPKYGLFGKLVAQKGKGEDLSKILLGAASLMKTAQGCQLYVVGFNKEYPDEIWITEIWDSRQDHANSLKIPGVRELIAKAIPILEGSQQKGQELEIIGGLGIE